MEPEKAMVGDVGFSLDDKTWNSLLAVYTEKKKNLHKARMVMGNKTK